MRTFSCTLLPMLIAAILVAISGEKLSRQERTNRTNYDRERLLDFSDHLLQESERLEAVFQKHLSELAGITKENDEKAVRAWAEPLLGLHSVHVFRTRKRDFSVRLLGQSPEIPEVEMEERKSPLKPERAVILPEEIFEQEAIENGLWFPTPNPNYRLYCQRPTQ